MTDIIWMYQDEITDVRWELSNDGILTMSDEYGVYYMTKWTGSTDLLEDWFLRTVDMLSD